MARLQDKAEADAYRFYLTDTLFYMSDNKRMTKRFYDILHTAPAETRSADEITADIIKRLGES